MLKPENAWKINLNHLLFALSWVKNSFIPIWQKLLKQDKKICKKNFLDVLSNLAPTAFWWFLGRSFWLSNWMNDNAVCIAAPELARSSIWDNWCLNYLVLLSVWGITRHTDAHTHAYIVTFWIWLLRWGLSETKNLQSSCSSCYNL